jgi:16S rRNA (uracil1498-N3)-methyltransferase
MTLRLFVGPLPLAAPQDGLLLAHLPPGTALDLPAGAARHAQVRRVQPGDRLALFDGSGSDWPAEVLAMGRQQVRVRLGAPQPVPTELRSAVTLAVGMPANERMDALVEKATELGVTAVQPLLCERAVLRLEGERAEKRRAHWQAVAVTAAEQCGRARVPMVAPVARLPAWLAALPGLPGCPATRLLLSTAPGATPLAQALAACPPALTALSGPEGGLSPAELQAALQAGFRPVSLGPRVLRADTAPLALLAWLGLTVDGARADGA